MLLARTKYSREFETAADEYAFKLLRQKGYSPTAFAAIMERLAKGKEAKQAGLFAYISSHPMTKERAERAREAATVKTTASQNNAADEVRHPLSLSEEETRSMLTGTWFGDQLTAKGARYMWIVQRKEDGTYKTRSRLINLSGDKQDRISVGEWAVAGGIYSSIHKGDLDGDELISANPARPAKRNDFRILNLTDEIFEYQRVDSNNKITVRRVPADFDLSAGWEYSVFREGFTKQYDYTLTRGNETKEARAEVVVGPKENLNGIEVSTDVFALWRPGAGPYSVKHFSAENDEGVRIIADQGPSDDSPHIKDPNAWDLKYPLAAGKTWIKKDEIHSLKEKFTAPITYAIEAMDDVVSVPAGTFKNCMRIKESFSGKVNFSSHGGEAEVELEAHSWYTPGIGEIKSAYNIKCSNAELGGGEWRMEMISHKN
jgi:hypothetical protein